MSRPGSLLAAALLRPVNLLTPGAGLLFALTWAPWWAFPLSFVPYAIMVLLTLRDPAFVQRTALGAAGGEAGVPIDWGEVRRELGRGPWDPSLARISAAEHNLGHELAQAPEGARSVLASTLAQVRSATTMGLQLARRMRSLDDALRGVAGMDAGVSRREADEKRGRASTAQDPTARKALLDAANALEESARTSDSLRSLRERTAAQLESLSAMLESVAVRGVRLRVHSDGGSAEELGETLGAEMDAVRETLGVLESIDEPGADARRT
jgi:hypothetical protein